MTVTGGVRMTQGQNDNDFCSCAKVTRCFINYLLFSFISKKI